MAQPAPAPQISPKVTIRIQNGVPDQDSVPISVGEEVEFHNEDNTAYQIPLSYLVGGSPDNYPLSVYLPAGGKFGLIGQAPSTCQYSVSSVSAEGRVEGGPPYNIIVNG
jgi:hypothetical protein